MIRLCSASETRQRFGGISTMTEFRWRRDGLLPNVIKFNGRNFDRVDQIDEVQMLVIANAPKSVIRETVAKFNMLNSTGINEQVAA